MKLEAQDNEGVLGEYKPEKNWKMSIKTNWSDPIMVIMY